MPKQRKSGKLRLMPPDRILPNPENPRLFFRQEEMETLMVSINEYGVQVPVTVYQEGDVYHLIDGQRRWTCAKKLNLATIPAVVQEKPSPLENLLLMSNIHALREQWDYFTIASNLKRIMELFLEERGYEPNESDLSKQTGLTRGQIRRCQLLLDLPDHFKEMLTQELELPKPQQVISEDLFIEMERALKTVRNRLPEFEERLDEVRNTLVKKFRSGTIDSVTDFRQLSKIATAIDNIGIKKSKAERALNTLFDPDNDVSIREVYKHTVEFGYDERKAAQHVGFLNEYFAELIEDKKRDLLDEDFIEQLRELYGRLKALLET